MASGSTVSKMDRVVNGYDPNERAWMVFMKTSYNGREWAYDDYSFITNIHAGMGPGT